MILSKCQKKLILHHILHFIYGIIWTINIGNYPLALSQEKRSYLEECHVLYVCYLLYCASSQALTSHCQTVTIRLCRNMIFGLVTSIMVGNVLMPKGPIDGVLSIVWRSVSGLSLFYLMLLTMMFFNVQYS